MSLPEPTCIDLHSYWIGKRTQRKKPLLRRFWPRTALSDTNPHSVFRPREREGYKLRRQRRNDREGLASLERRRADLAVAQQILQMVLLREKTKHMLLAAADDAFQQALHEATDTTGVKRTPLVVQGKATIRDQLMMQASSAQDDRGRGAAGARGRARRQRSARQNKTMEALREAVLELGPGHAAAAGAGYPGAAAKSAQAGVGQRSGQDLGRAFRSGPWRVPFGCPLHAAGDGSGSAAALEGLAGRATRQASRFGPSSLEDDAEEALRPDWLAPTLPLRPPVPRDPAAPWAHAGQLASIAFASGAAPAVLGADRGRQLLQRAEAQGLARQQVAAAQAAAQTLGTGTVGNGLDQGVGAGRGSSQGDTSGSALARADATEDEDLERVLVGTAVISAAAAAVASLESPQELARLLTDGAVPAHIGRGSGALDGLTTVPPTDRGSDLSVGVGGCGAGEPAEDALGVAWALGLPAGRSMSREVLERMLRGRSSGGFASGAEQLVVSVRSIVTRQTMGMLHGGSAWELGAGLVPGVGSLGAHGEGWELLGQRPWCSAPPLQQARTRPLQRDPEYRWRREWSKEY